MMLEPILPRNVRPGRGDRRRRLIRSKGRRSDADENGRQDRRELTQDEIPLNIPTVKLVDVVSFGQGGKRLR